MISSPERIKEIVQEQYDEHGLNIDAFSENGKVSIKWLRDASLTEELITGNRAYQREIVSSIPWRQKIMKTVLEGGYKKIPEIHIRVIFKNTEDALNYYFELIDGQQRVTAVLDFLSGGFDLPTDISMINGVDVRGMSATQLKETCKSIYDLLLRYTISCTWYVNLDDDQTSDLFINLLNNVNTMKHQEKRNAILGALCTYIRDNARPIKGSNTPHELFSKITLDLGTKKEKVVMKHFSEKKFKLNGHMELDEWISEMIYFKLKGYKSGLSQQTLTNWVTDKQTNGGEYKNTFPKIGQLKKFWDTGLKVLKAVDAENWKYRMTPMVSQMIILFADEIECQHSYKIQSYKKYVQSWIATFDKYSDPTVYGAIPAVNSAGETFPMTLEGTPSQPLTKFSTLFGGKGQLAISNIRYVLNMEFDKDPSVWGAIKLDHRITFPEDLIWKRYREVGMIDEYTGISLDEEDVAGDHDIPRSWGIDAGGVTEYENLRVCSRRINILKKDKSGEQFMKFLSEQKALPKAA